VVRENVHAFGLITTQRSGALAGAAECAKQTAFEQPGGKLLLSGRPRNEAAATNPQPSSMRDRAQLRSADQVVDLAALHGAADGSAVARENLCPWGAPLPRPVVSQQCYTTGNVCRTQTRVAELAEPYARRCLPSDPRRRGSNQQQLAFRERGWTPVADARQNPTRGTMR